MAQKTVPVVDITNRTDGRVIAWDAATSTHDYVDQSGVGGTVVGQQAFAPPIGYNPAASTTAAPAGVGYLQMIQVSAPMKIRGWQCMVSTSAAGSMQWGLFDASSNAAAATKIAGGTGAVGGTGSRVIAATGAPVDVDPGFYFIIILFPATNCPTLQFNSGVAGAIAGKNQTAYVWSDTPDLTTGWVAAPAIWNAGLTGDIDASGNQW